MFEPLSDHREKEPWTAVRTADVDTKQDGQKPAQGTPTPNLLNIPYIPPGFVSTGFERPPPPPLWTLQHAIHRKDSAPGKMSLVAKVFKKFRTQSVHLFTRILNKSTALNFTEPCIRVIMHLHQESNTSIAQTVLLNSTATTFCVPCAVFL